MARNLYALLVGINEYDKRSRIPSLRGCVNDIHGMQAYLEGRVAGAAFELHPLVLIDEQATRQRIVDGFQQHLSQAGAEDVVLFYYAGHGAQANAPEEFWPVAPDRMLETLVCYDSRIDDDHWDLADKELAQLIADVDRQHPHIVVILDCCHSGSGTREGDAPAVATRQAPPDWRQRPLASFLVSPHSAQALTGNAVSAGTRHVTATAIQLPVGRHVVLSACSNVEEAKEYLASGEPRGTFSYFLQASLTKAKGRLSYRDLFKRTNALVRSSVRAQSPQMEATCSEDLAQPFLGGAIAPSVPYFTVSHHREHGWVIDGGAIHGLQPPTDETVADQTTTLALFEFDAPLDQLKTVSGQIGTANITQVLPQLSKVVSDRLGEEPETFSETFKAVVLSSPLPPLQVFVTGDAVGVDSLRQAIATVGPSSGNSLYVQAIAQMEGAAFRAIAQHGTYVITAATDNRPLVQPVSGYDIASALRVAQNLEHIARWKTIAELDSPASSQIQGAVELKIYTGEQANKDDATEITDAQVRLAYQPDSTQQTWMPPRFRLKLHNTSEQTLYCAVFYLTERFKADAIKPDGVSGLVRLLPDQEIWFANGAALKGTVADALWREGITESQDILKLIACTDEFDPMLMTLGELGAPRAAAVQATRSLSTGGSLGRLMQRVNTREIGFADEPPRYDDWVANQITFTFVRPQRSTPLQTSAPTAVGSTVMMAPHPKLVANVRLTTVPQSTRDLGSAILPSLLQAETEPFQFTLSRASDPGLSALELSNVSHLESVTPEQPLHIETEMPLDEGEYVLPIAYDGEFYLPLGYGKAQDGKTKIVIERLTEPVSEGHRSVQGAIRIFFRKVIAKKLGDKLSEKWGLTFEYPFLSMVQLSRLDAIPEVPSGSKVGPKVGAKIGSKEKVTLSYHRDLEVIRAQVADADKIALCVHGIFGDSESILPSLQTAIATIEDESRSVGALYDLVLAFDYENLNTPIDQNARLLKSRLEAIGLGAGHGKTLHIIAHSMGGLVSRWLIEQEGGDDMVNHLMMLGTPNAGSPWPQVQAGITAAVSFAINGLSWAVAPLQVLAGLLQRIETLDVSLDQMEPGSDFLAEMAAAADPQIPYTLVVGNTSLMPADETAGLKQKLMRKLGKVAELPFFDQPNDIAVSVESIMAVPAGRSPAPNLLPTACNHLEYFVTPVGLRALSAAVLGTGIADSVKMPQRAPEMGLEIVPVAASGSVASVRSPSELTLPVFEPLPPRPPEPAPTNAPSPSVDDTSEMRAATGLKLPSKLWIWVLGAVVLGGLCSWGWSVFTRLPAAPLPDSSTVEPTS